MAVWTYNTYNTRSPDVIGESFNTDNCLFGDYSWMKPLSILQQMYICAFCIASRHSRATIVPASFVLRVVTYFLKQVTQIPALTKTEACSYQCHANLFQL